MIRSLLFSVVGTLLIVLGVGFWVNNWFLQGYNWLWLAIPSFWLCYKGFSKIFRIMDVIILIGVIVLIIYVSQHGMDICPFGK